MGGTSALECKLACTQQELVWLGGHHGGRREDKEEKEKEKKKSLSLDSRQTLAGQPSATHTVSHRVRHASSMPSTLPSHFRLIAGRALGAQSR